MSASKTGAEAKAVALAASADLDELSRFSAPGPGVSRLAYGDEDARARRWFKEQCERIGLSFRADSVGNCLGFMPGYEDQRPLLIGSHLDSVLGGGRYDGTLGVVLGLKVIEWFMDKGASLPLAVANFACEESTRFGFGSIGSRFLVGDLIEDAFEVVVDLQGQSLGIILASAGFEELGGAVNGARVDFRGYVEVHIDQGTTLTSMEARLAVVTRIAGVHRTEFIWTGEEAHSGGRVRSERRDALVAAADFIVRANKEWEETYPDERSLAFTIGRLSVEPNGPNTVPGRVDMVLDIRSVDLHLMERMRQRLGDIAEEVADQHRVAVLAENLGQVDPVSMDARLVETFEQAAVRVGVTSPQCVSLAGHDALVLGQTIPAGMLLLANPTGISHAPEESVDDQAVIDCALVLMEAIPDLINVLA